MGADWHGASVKLKPRTMLSDTPNTFLTGMFGRDVSITDIEIAMVPKEVDLGRNYRLFSWLAGVCGETPPLHENLEERGEKVLELLDWLGIDNDYNKTGDFWIGDSNWNYVSVKELVEFNYDAESVPGGDTYRELFMVRGVPEEQRDEFFKFIQWCSETGQDWIVFGFYDAF
jgi:hypothetical protein